MYFDIIVESIDLANMNVDFYAGNLHKWAYASKGTGFVWTNPLHQGSKHPLNTGHNLNNLGTNDSATKYIAAADAIQFYNR